MPGQTIELPKSGFALEIDGRLKTEFSTKEGAEHGAIELKRRFRCFRSASTTPARQDTAADVHGPGRGRRRRPRPPDARISDVIERQPPPVSHVRLAPPPRR